MKAIFNHTVIAQSAQTVLFDGSTYFPPGSIVPEYFEPAHGYTTTCPVKGTASYYTVAVNGAIRDYAAWAYNNPTPEAANIKGYFAFWKGIKIEK